MKRTLAALGALTIAAAVGLTVTTATGADDPIAARKALMKDRVGANAKLIGDMLKADFDLAKAKGAADAISKALAEYPTLFPDSSKEGGESTASPKIWENMADFVAKAKSLETDAAAAAASADEAQFKEAAGKIFGNCKSCHEAFRKPS